MKQNSLKNQGPTIGSKMTNTESNDKYSIGIDASNLLRGGGRTHLIELLRVVEPNRYGFEKIIVWGADDTLSFLDDTSWLIKKQIPALNEGLFQRLIWQYFILPKLAHASGCSVLFTPGGNHFGRFHPVVTMSRNMLPFEWKELLRYGFSLITFRLILLKFLQLKGYRNADGIIYLSRYAKKKIQKISGKININVSTIPHGINRNFYSKPKQQYNISSYSQHKPYRLIYVSIVDRYKHQWHLVEAVALLRKKTGWPIVLDLIGPSYQPALNRLQNATARFDREKSWVFYHGEVAYSKLIQYYSNANLGVFASSCENLPNILLETMASGLPIVCSDNGPMPEILDESGLYFDPENPKSIFKTLQKLISSPDLRSKLANGSFSLAQKYSWNKCANDTMQFLSDVVIDFKSKQ
jgi:glycosyltransferase involved in cell wall biosynthesis